MTSLEDARALDAADPLRSFRDRFSLPGGVIYLDGNSLGALPKATPERLRVAATLEWGEGLIRSWNDADWIGAPSRVGGKIAGLVGAKPHEVVVADSTSVNLFKLLAAAVAARPGRPGVLYQAGDFPTDGYMAEGLAALVPGVEPRAVAGNALPDAMDETVAVVLLSHVHYKTAARWDMAALTARAHAAGALIVWDLSHSGGAIEVDLRQRVHRSFSNIFVKFQFEFVGQHVLKHGVKIVQVVGMVRFGFHVKALIVKPARSARDLPHGNFVHQANHQLHRSALGDVGLSARIHMNSAARSTRLREFYGRDFEGQPLRLLLADGYDANEDQGVQISEHIFIRR